MRLLANFEAHDFRAIFQTGLDLRTQLGQRFLAGGAPGADGKRFIAPRSVAVAFDAFHENWNLHDKPAYFGRRLYLTASKPMRIEAPSLAKPSPVFLITERRSRHGY
jgi:hypothetical protein